VKVLFVSMATVCGCSLAMLDAGVPLIHPVAGVALGLILPTSSTPFVGNTTVTTTENEAAILTDILGLEDFLGSMDCKIAGSETGISAIQLDVKCIGLSLTLLERTLSQARRGRISILETMNKELNTSRTMKDVVPR
jgi:polyribonucleotide nucleotidyltransferase